MKLRKLQLTQRLVWSLVSRVLFDLAAVLLATGESYLIYKTQTFNNST